MTDKRHANGGQLSSGALALNAIRRSGIADDAVVRSSSARDLHLAFGGEPRLTSQSMSIA